MSTKEVHEMAHSTIPAQRFPSAAQIRLRRTVAVLVLMTLALIGVFALGRVSGHAATPSAGSAPAHPTVITVEPGDTLWSIATKADPNGDPRNEVQLIRELNGLSSASVQVGQRLTLPN